DEIIGYISGRPNGEAISQTLTDEMSDLPHFVIGSKDSKTIINYLEENINVIVEGSLLVKSGEVKNGKNINVLFSPENVKSDKIIICAHYDTMFNTPGAYDNSSGAAIL